MNKLIIIGNLTRDPELRTMTSGDCVCNFSVAVNRRTKREDGKNDVDYFDVSAWRQLGENCAKYLQKGKKVFVMGPVSTRTYERNDGGMGVSLRVDADTVEFLSPKGELGAGAENSGFTPVEMGDDLPFDQQEQF